MGNVMWETVPLVTSGFALAAFLAASVAWVWRAHLARSRNLIQTASEKDRGKLVAQALESYAIDTSKLTRERQYELAVQQITARETRFKWGAAVFTAVAVLVTAVALAAVFRGKAPDPVPPSPGPTPPAAVDEVEISAIDFLNYAGDEKAPRLDIKLTNRGTRSAFITAVKLHVKKVWPLNPLPQLTSAVVPPSHAYKVVIAPGESGKTYTLKVSHGLKADEQDRFTVQVEEHPWPGGNSIYWVKADIVANANDAVFSSKDLFCVVTQYGAAIPDKAWVERMAGVARERSLEFDEKGAREAIKANQRIVLEVAKLAGVKSPSLEAMIKSATKTDID
jgi:hypothetical protein